MNLDPMPSWAIRLSETKHVDAVFPAAGTDTALASFACDNGRRWTIIHVGGTAFGSGIAVSSAGILPCRPFAIALAALLAFLLSMFLSGNATAQNIDTPPTQIPNWAGSVEVSTTSLTIAPGQTVSYSIRLRPPDDWDEQEDDPFIPNGKEWLVMLHVDGVRNDSSGEYKDLAITPGLYRTFTTRDWSTWKDFSVKRLNDEEWAAKGGGARATSVTFDHEIVDHDYNCPVHDAGPVTVNIGNSNSGGGNNGNDGNRGNGGNVGNSGNGGNVGNSGNGGNDGNDGNSGNGGNVGNDGNSGNGGNDGNADNGGNSGNGGNDGNADNGGNSGNDGNVGNNGDGGNGGGGNGGGGNGGGGNGGGVGQSTPDGSQQSRAWANRAVLPEMGRALAFSAARCRIEQMFSDIARGWSRPPAARLLPPAFAGHGAERTRTLGLKHALGDVSYILPLAGGDGRDARFAAWACSDYRRLDGSDKGGTALWHGDVFNMQFGAETRLRSDLLAGVALSRAESDIDYTMAGETGEGGNYDLRLTGVHPYFGLKPSSELEIWGTAGFGQGTLQVSNSAGAFYSGDARLVSGSFGVNNRLLQRKSMTLTVKGEFGLANLDVSSASRTFANAAADLQRFRLAAELDHEEAVPNVGILAPWGELGLRHDSGDGKTGASIEVGGGLHYRNIEQGWNSEVFGRWLAARGSGRPEERGFGLRFRYDPEAPGFGPWASLAQSWGPTASGIQRLWDDRQGNPARSDLSARRLEVELAYGFRTFRSRGTLTPFGKFSLSRGGGRVHRIGARVNIGPSAMLSLSTVRRERSGGDDIHAVILEAAARF